MPPTKKRKTRLVTGCERCRVRHFKCDTNGSDCAPCQEAQVKCMRSVNVRFRSGLDLAEDQDVAFPESKSWPRWMGSVHFHDETLEIQRSYTVTEPTGVGEEHEIPSCSHDIKSSLGVETPSEDPSPLILEESENQALPGLAQLQEANLIPPDTAQRHQEMLYPTRTSRVDNHVPSQSILLNEREAILMRNFIDNMALWADINDPQRHFETHIPAIALQEPILRYAIFAFSARHMDRQKGTDSAEALQYHNHCLQMLISALSGMQDNVTDVILAAVAILRQHEEMDRDDNQFHLTGVTRILNTMSSLGSSGGLAEATAWLCLRQDIYISLTTQKPLRTNLENFLHSNIFSRNDDFAWAARMVFLLARVLKCAFGCEQTPAHLNLLYDIDREVEHWNATKPFTFSPIRYVPRGKTRGERFPEIWMLLPVHVLGVQYYHIAKIVLTISSCPSPTLGYETLKQSRNIEKNIRDHLLTILGLTKSNIKAENSLFTARHCLVTWGWVLRNKLDQEAAEAMLLEMETITGWSTKPFLQSLREQWYDENSDD